MMSRFLGGFFKLKFEACRATFPPGLVVKLLGSLPGLDHRARVAVTVSEGTSEPGLGRLGAVLVP
jgi:hypothetical protein